MVTNVPSTFTIWQLPRVFCRQEKKKNHNGKWDNNNGIFFIYICKEAAKMILIARYEIKTDYVKNIV